MLALAQQSLFVKRLFVEVRRPKPTKKWILWSKIRYIHRHLLQPPDVPATPDAELTLSLYKHYGHPYSKVIEALTGHFMCGYFKVAAHLHRCGGLPWTLSCIITGLIVTLLALISIEGVTLCMVFLLFVISYCLDILFGVVSALAFLTTHKHIMYAKDQILHLLLLHTDDDSWRDNVTMLDAAGRIGMAVGCYTIFCFVALLAKSLLTRCVKAVWIVVEWLQENSSAGIDEDDRLHCVVCMQQQRTQYFQPCAHLVCCKSCAQEMLNCPVCMAWISQEITVPKPIEPTICMKCRTQNVKRILFPCGHVICCGDCARHLEDCLLCWEMVVDDKPVYMP